MENITYQNDRNKHDIQSHGADAYVLVSMIIERFEIMIACSNTSNHEGGLKKVSARIVVVVAVSSIQQLSVKDAFEHVAIIQ